MSKTPNSPENIATISELLALSNSQYRIYDLGRKIDKISKEQFNKIELNQLPYPYPSQRHAFIAIAFWQKQPSQPFLWFVKLPLDERGLLNQGARDHFIAIIIEALGSNLTVDPSEKQEELLKGNPYHFTPSQYKLASLNSKLKLELKQNASDYFPLCQQYISGDVGWDNWHNIGVQGITDFASRINLDKNSSSLVSALPNLAVEVLTPLCSALENEVLPVELIDALIVYFNRVNSDKNSEQLQQHLLRALASSCHHPHVVNFINKLLADNNLSTEVLIILSGRCWLLWQTPQALIAYFECLVQTQDQQLFIAIFKDLVAIPAIRPHVFHCIREPKRSDALAQAIGSIFTENK